MNIHKSCAKQVEEVCIGQLHKKDTRFSAILGKIISDDKDAKRKISHINAAQSKHLCFELIDSVCGEDDFQGLLVCEAIEIAFRYVHLTVCCCYYTSTLKKLAE